MKNNTIKVKVATTYIDSENGQFTKDALKSQDGIEVPVGVTFHPYLTGIGTAVLEYDNGALWAHVHVEDFDIESVRDLYIVPKFMRASDIVNNVDGVAVDNDIIFLGLGMTDEPCDLNLTTIGYGLDMGVENE